MARKMFRLAKSISFLQAAWKAFLQETDPIVRGTSTIQNLCLALWLFYDHVIWATKVGLMTSDVVAHTKKSNVFWLISMICGVIKSLYLLQQTEQLASRTNKIESLEQLRQKQHEYFLEFFRNALDMAIPITGLSKRAAEVFPAGLVGLCGTITSLIGIYQVWGKTK